MSKIHRKLDDDINHFAVGDVEYNDAAKALPVYTIPQIANYLTKGYFQDQNPDWGARSWAPSHKTITYNLDGLSSELQDRARLAFATWDEITKLKFVEDTGNPSADINFTTGAGASYETDNVGTGHRITSATINIDVGAFSETRINSALTETFIHEIGHALGLGHGGNYNGSGGGTQFYQNDTRQFSVMSYGAQGAFGGASNADVLTPQMADIYAVIEKYGAASARATDTTYGFNTSGLTAATSFIHDFDNFGPSSEFGFNGIAPCMTIYDTGGVDTLDCSGYFFDQRLDLKGGAWSDVGQFKNIIGIYRTSVIENAFGGEGSDHIIGNQVANKLYGNEDDDFFSGLAGNDVLVGGTGADTFVFKAGWDKDKIFDFEDGIDKIDLRSFEFTKLRQVKAIATEAASGEDIVLRFGHGDVLTVKHLNIAEMNAADFVL